MRIIALAGVELPDQLTRWFNHIIESEDPAHEVQRIESIMAELKSIDYVKPTTREVATKIKCGHADTLINLFWYMGQAQAQGSGETNPR